MLGNLNIRTRLLTLALLPAIAGVVAVLAATSAGLGTQPALGIAAGGGLLAAAVAVAVAKGIVAPIEQLATAAEKASRLPTLVEALRRPTGRDQSLALTPVGLDSDDEIGRAAQAFDAFQGAAAKLAVSQAALLNKGVADKGTFEVFVNLARRMQGLVDHQIEFLDTLEAGEQDPDALENLFKLDQLATRVRRNAESLLTLAGSASARSWERPLAMSDVIRAGMAEVEDVGRVDLDVQEEVAMLGNVAADAAHLLSELLENATRWSPPDARVIVTGARGDLGYEVTVEDSGIGMTVDALAEANHILTGPPLAGATVARSLGLVVAGRLAKRLGVSVRLTAASTGGVLAKVLIPPSLLVAAEDAELALEEAGTATGRTLPFALARQEKRARISSQRRRRPRDDARSAPSDYRSWREEGEPGEATIINLPEPVAPPAPPPVPSAPEPAFSAGSDDYDPAPPPPTVYDSPTVDPLADPAAGTDPLADVPAAPAPPAEPPAAEIPDVEPLAMRMRRRPPAAEPPAADPPAPSLPPRPSRFAAATDGPSSSALPSRPRPAGRAPAQDEYLRHLERATANGLVRRIPKASLPADTGGAAERVPPAAPASAAERLPEEVRSLLSSYRSGVRRGRTEDPSPDQPPASPQEGS